MGPFIMGTGYLHFRAKRGWPSFGIIPDEKTSKEIDEEEYGLLLAHSVCGTPPSAGKYGSKVPSINEVRKMSLPLLQSV